MNLMDDGDLCLVNDMRIGEMYFFSPIDLITCILETIFTSIQEISKATLGLGRINLSKLN